MVETLSKQIGDRKRRKRKKEETEKKETGGQRKEGKRECEKKKDRTEGKGTRAVVDSRGGGWGRPPPASSP